MSLNLTSRQRAMLLEMGIKVWQPAVAEPLPGASSAAETHHAAAAAAPAMAAPAADMVLPKAEPPAVLAARHDALIESSVSAEGQVKIGENQLIHLPNLDRLPPGANSVPMPVTDAPAALSAPEPPLARAPAVPIIQVPGGPVVEMDWDALREAVAGCRACGLCESRTQTVFGVGAQRADWMVVGEAPGEQEDLRGEPFVGPAGQLLDNMLHAVGLNRQAGEGEQAVFIANVLKCRPPANRNPAPEEIAQCQPYLRRQVALVQPKVILAMGRFAVQALLGTTEPIGRLRQQVHSYEGVPVIVSYHPAYLLRNLPEKAKAWADLVLAMQVARQGLQGD